MGCSNIKPEVKIGEIENYEVEPHLILANSSKRNLIKVVLLGDCSVGKTSIIKSFTNRVNDFDEVYKSTLSFDFAVKSVTIGEQTKNIQIWDTAGQEQFHSMTASFLKRVSAAFIVFDITNLTTFKNICNWQHLLTESSPNCKIILIGNKFDILEKREILYEDAQEYATLNDMLYFEVSAKSNHNIELAFQVLIQNV
eukprot:TRINITY_DN315_c3_g1_i2.p1 TRINITY_DN315_c3_g1~~TRINITY_DN315_c3_g1_i2.p1  ORF type:complete len:197 (-),score=63.45 TRINITY_DN315_c3_g1_i2:48-638(-)